MSKSNKMSKSNAHKVKVSQLNPSKISLDPIQSKNKDLSLWKVLLSRGGEKKECRIQLPPVTLKWNGRSISQPSERFPNPQTMLVPLDTDDEDISEVHSKIKEMDAHFRGLTKSLFKKEKRKYIPILKESGEEDDRPDFMQLKFQKNYNEDTLKTRIYQKTAESPMKHLEEVNTMEALRDAVPYNSTIQMMIEPSVGWASSKSNDDGDLTWGVSWRIVFLRINKVGDGQTVSGGSKAEVINYNDLEPSNISVTEWQKVSTDKQDIAYVRHSGESFMLELPAVTINDHGAPRIMDDDGNVLDPNYWKLPLYPDNEEHQSVIDKINGIDEQIEGQFSQIFGSEKNAKKYFMTETVRVPEDEDDDEDEDKKTRPPYLKLNLKTEYSSGKLITKIFDCTGDDDTSEEIKCSDMSEFFEHVRYRGTYQMRIQFHKFYAMKSKAGGKQKRAGIGAKIHSVRILEHPTAKQSEANDDFLDDDDDATMSEELDIKKAVAKEKNVKVKVEVSDDEVSDDDSDEEEVSDDDESDISEDESEEETPPPKVVKKKVTAVKSKKTKTKSKSKSKNK
jgi:hypothetical protein